MKRRHNTTRNVIITILVVVLVVGANVVRSNSLVRNLQVSVDYQGCDTLVIASTIHNTVSDAMPQLLAQKVKDVDLKAVKAHTMSSPYVADCHAYVSVLGNVVVKAEQRRPLLHTFYRGREFYIDDMGRYMPLSNQGSANVMVVNGFFAQADSVISGDMDISQWAADTNRCNYDLAHVWQLAHYIDQHDYMPLFDQIYVDSDHQLILTPKLGSHIVVMGDADDLDSKFERLMALYKQALPRVGWDRYAQVSLKYHDQIVCTKR